MKNSDKFTWTQQADSAFHELNKMLATTLILASPLSKEPMLLYFAATNRVVSAVIVVEREERGQICPKTSVLLERSALCLETELPALSEDDIWGIYGIKEA